MKSDKTCLVKLISSYKTQFSLSAPQFFYFNFETTGPTNVKLHTIDHNPGLNVIKETDDVIMMSQIEINFFNSHLLYKQPAPDLPTSRNLIFLERRRHYQRIIGDSLSLYDL